MESVAVLILAAGLGKRMGLNSPKVLAKTAQRTLLSHVLETAFELKPAKLVLVTGFGREQLEQSVLLDPCLAGNNKQQIEFAYQAEQLGTGHAVKCALPQLKKFTGTVLILCGDVPLIRSETLRALLEFHACSKSTISLISFKTGLENAYGRVLRDSAGGNVSAIVEARDCKPQEISIDELNSGIYALDSAFLSPAVEALTNDNAQKEYYLTDIVARAAREGQKVSALLHEHAEEFLGVNNLFELSLVNCVLMDRKIKALIEQGVLVEDPATLYIDPEIEIAAGAKIGPNVQIRGNSKIEKGVILEGSACLINCHIKENALVRFGVRAENAIIGKGASVGPFAHLRPGTVLEEEVRVGNFVEVKNSHLLAGSKASHLTYLGDAEVGAHANIGAGTITCNYDGVNKNQTVIGEKVFIGSNSCLVAPVTVGEGAYVGAGSVITKDVEKNSLALTRPDLVVKKDWAKNKREKSAKKH